MNQEEKRKKSVENWLIDPIRWVFPRTKTKGILSSKLYENLQRSIWNSEYFFKLNENNLEKNNISHNRKIFNTLTDVMVIDKDKLPENFIKLFELDTESPDIEKQTKEIFKKSRFIPWLDSHRIILIDDKIIVFRNEERLVHKNTERKLTQWEKRRTEIFTTFNTFSNIYDAVRSQYHIIDSEKNKQNEIKLNKDEIVKLMQDIRFFFTKDIKNPTLANRLQTIIDQTISSTNAKILGANLYNFKEITFGNSSIDSNRLEWWKNKFQKRFNEIENILWVVNKHLAIIEEILNQHEHILDYMTTQAKFTNKDIFIPNYQKSYKTLESKYWEISPFNTFHSRIEKYKNNDEILARFINKISQFYELYKKEHTLKLANIDLDEDFLDILKTIKENISWQEMEAIIKNN